MEPESAFAELSGNKEQTGDRTLERSTHDVGRPNFSWRSILFDLQASILANGFNEDASCKFPVAPLEDLQARLHKVSLLEVAGHEDVEENGIGLGF